MKRIYLTILIVLLTLCSFGQTKWIKYEENPVLSGDAGQWDESLNYIGSVVFYNNQYHMWYNGFSESSIHNVGHVISPDGIHWTKGRINPVFGQGSPGSWDQDYATCGAVCLINDTLHMWYTGYKDGWGNSAIGHAVSTDGGTGREIL
ncbi:hypothetical protein [Maribellus mangrovi]|uniref:hypothetical protein n=1 Tax=Maribellus mangrovi TaxID=3133146 RepID=UPI0030EBCCDE